MSFVRLSSSLALASVLLCSPTRASAAELRVEVGLSRSPTAIHAATDGAVRNFARQTALLGRKDLERRAATGRLSTAFTMPLRVVLTRNGVPLPMAAQTRAPGTDLVPTFDASGARSFPSAYRTLLESVFTSARPVMNAVYGSPKVAGTVYVRNYDADIQDRYAVAGGYYIPNGPDGPEIRFPVYFSAVGAAVNYVHTLLLAYAGDAPYPVEAVGEGLVRAATMRVVRTPGALPDSPDPAVVEATLDSLYDVSAFYDWYNQPALGGPSFIAPNLLNVALPPGGSTGGVFLIRYMMAGTAWSKVLTQYPGFGAEFNSRYYASPGSFTSADDFAALGQETIDFLAGLVGALVEGRSFADWMERQFIFDDEVTAGVKVMVQPFPVVASGGTSDFGVFGIDVNAFRTSATGDEALLAGTVYPVYWRPDFVRQFASVQDDVIKLAGAYGSVVPNFVSEAYAGQPYRVAVDVPYMGVVTRVMLPAGAYSTAGSPAPNNFIGSLTGFVPLSIGSYEVTIEWVGGSHGPVTVQHAAFGSSITDTSFNNAQVCTVRIFLNDGTSSTEIFSRQVNKGVGMLALDIKSPDCDTTFSLGVLGKLGLAGVPLQPYRPRPTRLLGIADGQTLFAQWNPLTVRYDLFPDVGQVVQGAGFYWRPPADFLLSVDGVSPPNTTMSASLLPGWNAFAVPFDETIGTANLSFTVATESVAPYVDAVGTTIGTTVFEFVPDVTNPDWGTLVPATSFSPGKGYFVRALRPEGALMVFTPGGFTTSAATRSPSSAGISAAAKFWEARLEFKRQQGVPTSVVLGQSTLAAQGFDPRFESELPPSPGGFQAGVVTDRVMYKDVGNWRERTRRRIDLRGLKIGETVTIKVSISGAAKEINLTSTQPRVRARLTNGATVSFRATGPTASFEFDVARVN